MWLESGILKLKTTNYKTMDYKPPLVLRHHTPFVCVQMLQRHARAAGHAVQGVFGKDRFDAESPPDKFRKIAQERGAAGHYYSAVYDIRRKLRRGLLEDVPYGFDYFPQFAVYG